jgi:Lrp/AsnC family transcriptional regulator for asnA, asnC and gidA
VADHLREQSEVRYAGISVGRYDLVIEAVFDDQEHLLHFVTSKLGAIEGITGVETSMILKVAKFTYEWELP